MISMERKLFEEKSDARARICEYGKSFDELHVIVFSLKKLNHTEEQISKQVTIYPTNSFNRFLYMMDAVIIADGILREKGMKGWVVSTQDPFETGWPGLRLKKKYNLPLQVQVHGDDIGNARFRTESFLNRIRLRIADKVLPQADCIRVVSKRIKRTLVHRYTLQCEPVVLPIWRDISGIQKAEVKYDLRTVYPRFNFIALIASRLEKEKNVGLAIRAFKAVVAHDAKAGLIIVGDGGEQKRLKRLVSNLGLEKNVIFEGWQNDVISRYKTADIFLNTSNHEGYCLSLVEAASAGCPIATTDVGIIGEALNESNVFICPVGDRECFEKKIISAIHNEPVLARIAEKARESILRNAKSKKEYLDRYRESFNQCIL